MSSIIASATCTVNNTPLATSGTTGLNVAASSTITIKLANTSGVSSWSIVPTSADDLTSSNGNLLAVQQSAVINYTSFSATFVMPPMDGYRGSSIQFTSTVNGNSSVTFGVFVLNTSGTRLFFGGETNESNATVGNAADLNAIVALGGGSAVTLSGDVTGLSSDTTVVGLYNYAIANTAPIASAVPVWDTTLTHYDIRPLTMDDILAGFSINSFSGGSTVEIGLPVVNPTFTASYSATPTSANITNTDSIDSPLTLTTPFTSGTVVGTFNHASEASVTFTLTAVGSSTKTATAVINFYPRCFGGLGGGGAASATASGTSAILNSSLGTLSNLGLFNGVVGQSFGPFSPTAQYIYLLLPHTSSAHTFTAGGFSFAMNTPTTFTFVNANSQNISMDLYQSTNQLSTPFTIYVSG